MQKRYVVPTLLALLFLLSSVVAAQTPPAPTNLKVDTSLTRPGVFLSWNTSTTGWWFYRIYRSADDSMHYSLAGQTIFRSFRDANVDTGRTYFYYVTAATLQDSTVTESGPSNVVSVTVKTATGRVQGTIAGTVTDSSMGTPVGAVRLIFFRVSSPARRHGVPQAWTDSLGHYSALVDTGTYIIRVQPQWSRIFGPSPYFASWYNNARTPRQAARVTVADTTTDTVNIALVKLAQPTKFAISGTVTDTAGTPLKGAIVGAIRSVQDFGRFGTTPGEEPGMESQGVRISGLGFIRGLISKAVTDSMGKYQLQVDSGRQVILLASDSGYVPQFHNGQHSPLEATVFNLSHDTTGIDFRLQARDTSHGSVAGTVTDSSGAPIPSRVVLIPLRSQNRRGPGAFGYTDSTGAFSITNVAAGSYVVLALPYTGYAPGFYKAGQTAVSGWEDADSVNVSGAVTGINIRVVPFNGEGFATVQGTAQSAGQGLGGVIVTARDSAGGIVGYTLTDATGAYAIESLPPGSFTVVANKEGYSSPDTRNVNIQAGDFSVTGINFTLTIVTPTAIGDAPSVPESFALEQNYPNPFNPTTEIRYQIPAVVHVRLSLYDVLGQEVAVLVNEVKRAGTYAVQFSGARLASGTYFYTLQAGNFVATKKLLLLK